MKTRWGATFCDGLLGIIFAAAISLQIPLQAQVQAPSSDSTAVTVAQLFVLSSAGKVAPTTFAASGTGMVAAGPETQTASVQLASTGPQYSYAQFQAASSTYTEQRALDASGNVIGQFVNGKEPVTPIAYRNLYVASSWFFPLFSNLAQTSDTSLRFSYLGPQSWHGTQVLHVRVTKYISTNNPKLPTASFDTEYYLDAHSYLLAGISAELSPDDGSTARIPWEIRYGNYVAQQGVMVPMHIEQYLSGTLLRQIDLSSVQLNSAVPQSLFTF